MMLPTSTSHRSYTQQKRQPTGRRPPVARSNSLLGTLKNIVTAPLSWFAQDDDGFEDTKGKRRRLAESRDAGVMTENGGSRNKRIRVGSPDRQPDLLGYLDPPRKIFQQPHSAPPGSGPLPTLPSYPASISRSTSVTTPSHTVQRLPTRNNRHTVSPLRTSFTQAEIISRTMSMDPPARQTLSRDITVTPTRDSAHHYAISIPRDNSMSPTRSPFRMRTSITPQPSGPEFGPSLQQRREHASEPPTLEELMANPKFVRPPPPKSNHQRHESRDSTITLGSLVDSQRSNVSPARQHSALLFGPQGSDGIISSRSVNAAEKALHELDIYKTPLLPSRLRGSTAIPDMFKPKAKRSHTPILMHSEKDEKPRLGRSKRREVNGTKPYAGEGGMKKLLARRKQEEEEERMKAMAEAMDDGREDEHDDEVLPPEKQNRSYKIELTGEEADLPAEKRLQQNTPLTVPPVSRFGSSISSPVNYQQSSLRVGRTRTSRNHLSRPASRSNNRFSAVYDEEESDDPMLEDKGADQIALEEAAKKVPVFEVPPGFSFAKEVPQIQHDLTTAKEPPMSSLPFSFTKPSATKESMGTITSPPPSKEPNSQALKSLSSAFGPSAPPSDNPEAPSITFTAATSDTPKVITVEAPAAASGIPNFFENSEVLKRPPSTTPPGTSGSGVPNFFATSAVLSTAASASPPQTSSSVPNFFANSAAINNTGSIAPPQASSFSPAHATPTKDAENPLWEGEKTSKPAVLATKPFSFGDVHKPTSSPLFGVPPTGSSSSTIFNGETTHEIFESSATPTSVKEVETAPTTSVFGVVVAPKQTKLLQPPFSFGAPTKPNELLQQSVADPETSKVPEVVTAPPEATKRPPLFGSAPVSSFAGFGGSTAGIPTAETSKPAFLFGQPTSGASAPVHAPKPLFGAEAAGAFSFGQGPSSAPASDTQPSPASPFSFGAAPSTPPAGAEKKAPFTYGPSPVTAAVAASSTFSFGPPGGSSHGTDVSHKPFAFGNPGTAPARPVTPPKNEQEFRMEESPTRDMNGKAAEVPKPAMGGFSFGVPSVSMTGSTLFGQNNQSGQTSSGPFSFAGTSNTPLPNPFAVKPEEKQESKDLGFSGFGQNTSVPGFSFGQKPTVATPTTPSSTGGFSFGQAPLVGSTNTSTSFAFSGPPNPSNPFSQSPSNVGSAPNSPSTFNQSTPFSFTSPTAPNNPFAFGSSQPASPATNGNTSLPQAPGTPGGGFAFGQSSASAPQNTSPFQASSTTLPPVSGSLFTIGSAPPPAPSGGGRAIKKLPNRRTIKR